MTLYRLLAVPARLALRVYFRRLVLSGRLDLPPSGPLILAANHPNSLVDALAMGWACERPVQFLARSGLFTNPVLGRILRAAGGIPVYRRLDNPAEMGRNEESFREAHRVLAEGGVIGIFPEGISHEELLLKQLKTGIARIALAVEREHGWALGLRIVPVGLDFTDRASFRSDLFIRVGEPIEVRDWRDAYSTDPAGAVRALVEEVAGRIEALVVTVRHENAPALLRDIETTFGTELAGGSDDGRARQALRHRLALALTHFHAEDPAAAQRIRAELDAYLETLRRHRISDEAIRRAEGAGGGLRLTASSLARLTAAALALPAALWGTLVNLIPWLLTDLSGRRARTPASATMVSTAKILTGLVAYPAAHALLFWGGYRWRGPAAAALIVLSGAACGVIALAFLRALGRLRTDAAALRLTLMSRGLSRRLRRQRLELLRSLERHRDEFEARSGAAPR